MPAIHPGAIDICDGIDNDCDGLINEDCAAITIAGTVVTEGNKGQKAINFTIKLNKAPVQTVTVNYTTQNITAAAGSDYVAQSGVLTFAPGIKKEFLSVVVNGDKIVEPNETFKIVLSNSGNALIADNEGIGTIKNDDVVVSLATLRSVSDNAPSLSISPNPASNIAQVQLKGYSGDVILQLTDLTGKVLKGKNSVLIT